MDLSLAERIVGQSCSKTDNTAAAVVETPSGTKTKDEQQSTKMHNNNSSKWNRIVFHCFSEDQNKPTFLGRIFLQLAFLSSYKRS